MPLLSLATFNTAGFAKPDKRLSFDAFCAIHSVSICALQETNLKVSSSTCSNGNILGSPSSSPHAGLAFWLNHNISFENPVLYSIVPDKLLEISFMWHSNFYTVFNVHIPHSDSEAKIVLDAWSNRLLHYGIQIPPTAIGTTPYLENLHLLNQSDTDYDTLSSNTRSNLQKSRTASFSHSFIITGDFNVQMIQPSDSSRSWKRPSIRSYLEAIIASLDLRLTSLKDFSHEAQGTRGSSFIDYIAIPRAWNSNIYSLTLHQPVPSDHAMLLIKLMVDIEVPPHPPYWRFKNDLLNDNTFISSMGSFIDHLMLTQPIHDNLFQQWWDDFKQQISEVSRNCWRKLCRPLMQDHPSYRPPDTKPYKYQPTGMSILKKENGDILTDQVEILDALAEEYTNIFSPSTKTLKPPSGMSFGMSAIPEHLKLGLDLPLTVNELWAAATSMNLAKAPGIDGLTLELYLKFWDKLSPLIVRWFQTVLTNGCLSGSSSIGIINLIPKKGDLRSTANWRPINLLTVELKIVLRALTTRLRPVFAALLPAYQTALPGRSLFKSHAVVRDVISLATARHNQLFIVGLDQAKAFDNVNHGFLFHLLEAIGLPSFITTALKALYTGFVCRIKNRSRLSRPIPYLKGIRQGDSTSTFLYALALQPLLNMLHLALPQEGFPVTPHTKVFMTAFADDITLFINDLDSLHTVTRVAAHMALYSEAKINLHKSSVFAINVSPSHFQDIQLICKPYHVSCDHIKILGIIFSKSLRITPIQWSTLFDSTRRTLLENLQSLVRLTILERAHWAKKKLWPRWSFLFKTLQPTGIQCDRLATLFSEVIWLGAKHCLSLDALARHRSVGGLSALHPRLMLQMLRVRMIRDLLFQPDDDINFQLAGAIFDRYADLQLGFRILHTKPDTTFLSSLPSVYAEAFLAWDSLSVVTQPANKNELLLLPACNSKFLLQLENPICISISQAKSANIITLAHIYEAEPTRTRLSHLLHNTIKTVIDDLVWPSKTILPAQQPPNSSLVFSLGIFNFLIITPTTSVTADKWNNSLLISYMHDHFAHIRNLDIPDATWSILFSSIAPPPFVNQYWKHLHQVLPSPSFYFKMHIINHIHCILCKSVDVSNTHLYSTCPILGLTISFLSSTRITLEIPPLLDLWQLYPNNKDVHKLANFLIMAFVYTVTTVTRSIANYRSQISEIAFLQAYRLTIRRHLRIFAITHPPNCSNSRHHWSIFTLKKIIAYFSADKLYVLDRRGFSRLP